MCSRTHNCAINMNLVGSLFVCSPRDPLVRQHRISQSQILTEIPSKQFHSLKLYENGYLFFSENSLLHWNFRLKRTCREKDASCCGRVSNTLDRDQHMAAGKKKSDVNNNFMAINKLMMRSSVQPQAMFVFSDSVICELGNRTRRWWWLIQSINMYPNDGTCIVSGTECIRFYGRNF